VGILYYTRTIKKFSNKTTDVSGLSQSSKANHYQTKIETLTFSTKDCKTFIWRRQKVIRRRASLMISDSLGQYTSLKHIESAFLIHAQNEANAWFENYD
jgi:hypothetical protein